jgi:hypothetical protein
MAQDISRITLSVAQIWYAPAGEALPDETTVALGASWGGSWTKLGYTSAPVVAEYAFEIAEADIQESLAVVKRAKKAESFMLETMIAELDLAQYKLATEGATTVTAAGASQVGYTDLDLGGSNALTERVWGFEASWTNSSGVSFPVRLFVYKATSQAGGQLSWGKADYIGLPLKLKAVADMSKSQGSRLFKLQHVTAVATS